MQQTHLTPDEAERLAYLAGDTVRAQLFNELIEMQIEMEIAVEQAQELQEKSLAEWEEDNGPADAYKAFFEECFQRLAGHYPCPEVTSEYDCNVIFATIDRGEAADADGVE